ncbi:excinuclease ABC subunit UvrC [Campylobacter sp. VicNov18]|uniref:excinuclease ABC subunit UvrC n=1 Tax=Campylobacter bilis TaxID=2691918 RepID=UPI00130D7885|nr:excinuclease ABC subunit UvrC [Campylobacter bilis]MPV63135.1 excinuclease ABC subunit UvrC [Campylobacter hepaticus]MBM0636635.1 excinuclease ABC subunit UvrC [Campylobacter bilis]MCC8277479.1 excinuclease ABC subunit UvrC [Campylobacter bilis]MCC8298684.1 excinuclease ABC subunit UvrC [Campylobacter bilis]MCC8300388.1 excinuclease ABC subunit UvrC [Campylobacter bilis]
MLKNTLENELKTLPNSAGVYQYFDKEGKLLYIGKAKNLKNRVRSYFSFTPHLHANTRNSLRIQKMIEETVHLEFISTNSEADALILENSFIKQLHPKYNILLRDDKTYPYIYVDFDEEFPRFEITRKLVKKSKIKYFGPFFKGARELLDALYLYYPLKQKSSCKSPCTFYQISRCLAPCNKGVSKEKYHEILTQAIHALLNPNILVKNLEKQMLFLAQNENYEEAAKLRDQIATIKDLEVKIEIDIAKLEDFEVFALAFEKSMLSTLRFVVQNGKIISVNSKILPVKNNIEGDKNEIYKQLILENFSIDIPWISSKIYVYEAFEDRMLLEEILSQRFDKKISIKIPKIGEKRKICDLAFQNALLNIEKEHKNSDFNIQEELKSYFELENLPNYIEIFDNSHLQGVANVGAMVAYKRGVCDKSKYRKFHLKYKNDYEQMREVLTRRALDFDKMSPPDLWLIDGGKALLDLAKEILASSGANVDVLAISKEKVDAKAHRAKGGAKDKIHSIKGEFILNINDKKLQFLQKLRDEAHRFAITFHQNTKKKQDLSSSKLMNLGLNAGTIQKLLAYYGNFETIYKADFDELVMLVGKKATQKIKEN